MTAHFESLGNNLDRAVEHYNKAVGSFETRVLVSARKFSELGAPITTQIGELDQLQTTARTLELEWDEESADTKAAGNGELSKAAETGK